MSYYKYVPPKRVDILENLKIRFTQVSALNDPFESFPAVRLPDDPSKRFISIEEFQTRIRRSVETTTGIISLSETPENVLMWSHYADSHRGFVIEFNSNHEYFKLGTQKVKYSKNRPLMIAEQGDHYTDLFSTKSPDWAYEKEIRKSQLLHNNIEPLPNGNKFIRAIPGAKEDPTKIHLFDIPKEVITSVILGWKSDNKLRFCVADALNKNSMTHVKILHAIPSKEQYRMEIVSLSEKR
jgi:hypothetical protein